MIKLPSAPLVEVVCELRWSVDRNSGWDRISYLYGDIYNLLKEKYSFRESVQSPEIPMELLINSPVHRFRAGKDDYPLIQVGPGVLTLNTTGEKYLWESFHEDFHELLNAFWEVFSVESLDQLTMNLLFLDFFPFDFDEGDAYEYLSKMFNVKIEQSFFKTANTSNCSLGFSFKIPLGELSVMFRKGMNSKKEEGIVLQIRLSGVPLSPSRDEIMNWMDEGHGVCSKVFKDLTVGDLYESFKMKP